MSEAQAHHGQRWLSDALAGRTVTPVSGRWARAGIAVVWRFAAGPEVLLVRRAERHGDPWSGDMGFPGGFAHAGETGLQAARRETHEEVGLELGEPLGRLPGRRALRSLTRPFVIEPWVFTGDGELTLEKREIAEAVWLPWSELREPGSVGRQWLGPLPIPARTRRIGDYRIWGLTGRVLDELGDILLST